MRIAIASSGLGHVARGIETWALDTAAALERARVTGYPLLVIGNKTNDVPSTNNQSRITNNPAFGGPLFVTLFSGAPLDSFRSQIGAPSPLPSSRFPPTSFHTPILRHPHTPTLPPYPRHSDTPTLSIQVLPCLKRGDRTTQQLSNWTPPFLWRWGLKNPYGWEQLSFWLRLWPHLRRGKYDVLHVQDPMVANWCRLFRKWGWVRTKEILAHGTEETAAFLAKFEYVQHLAPWHLEAGSGKREAGRGGQLSGCWLLGCWGGIAGRGKRPVGSGKREEGTNQQPITNNQQPPGKWVVIPNFVDCEVFKPASGKGQAGSGKGAEIFNVGAALRSGEEKDKMNTSPLGTAAPTLNTGCRTEERQELRRRLGIPVDAFVVGCVAAVKKDHKRIDYLIGEVGKMVKGYSLSVIGNTNNHEQITDNRAVSASNNQQPTTNNPTSGVPFLLIAGARTDETDELIALAESLIPGRYKILTDVGRDQMPDLYRAMDVFVLTSLFEMMPIALLEALASGLPCIVNRHPVLEWMVGAEGAGELSGCFVAKLLSASPASPGELSGCFVAKLLSASPEDSLPSTTQQPSNLTTSRASGATQQPSNLTTSRASGATQQPSNLTTSRASGATQQPSNLTTSRASGATQQLNNLTTGPASGGTSIDMSREGALAAALAGLTSDWLERHGRQARERALSMFSKEAVIRQYVEYYGEVVGNR